MNDSHYFITGSWDNDQNSVKLWDFQVNQEDSEIDPFLIAEFPYKGDVTEAKVILYISLATPYFIILLVYKWGLLCNFIFIRLRSSYEDQYRPWRGTGT